MSDTTHISIYPDNEAQKQRIEAQARKHNKSVSEYCLMAIEQQIAREAEAERLDELNIESQLDELKETITTDISEATAVTSQQECYYEVALWELFGNGYPQEDRLEAMEGAPEQLKQDLAKMADKKDGET
jgi:hypothetical protein